MQSSPDRHTSFAARKLFTQYSNHFENWNFNSWEYLDAMTSSQPTNASEWQLYRVLQRANLLQYYDTFIAQGGDDVQQLCEAGEEEFLEIMALVGMASKPLHVRRLQKALQEWVANPAAFQGPVVGSSSPAPGSISATVRDQTAVNTYPTLHSTPPIVNAPTWNPATHPPPRNISPANTGSSSGASPQADIKVEFTDQSSCMMSFQPVDINMKQHSSSSPLPTPVLVESQIIAIAEAAARVAKDSPGFEPKELNLKKQINREIQMVMNMSPEDPNRMEELRKYAAIYGRFDSKRKNDKPMSLHEISVNEAAAQLCHHLPALLTRREDLFPLARQVVRESGYQYSKGHSSNSKQLWAVESPSINCNRASSDGLSIKRSKFDPALTRQFETNSKFVNAELEKLQREERMTAINNEMVSLKQKQDEIKSQLVAAKDAGDAVSLQKLQGTRDLITSRQLHLMAEQNEIIKKQRRFERYQMKNARCSNNGKEYNDDEATDSSNFPSGCSSPLNDSQDGESYFDFTKSDLYTATQKNAKLVQETLFDEGLRIAQQYGMADFAEQLKELQQQKPKSNITGYKKSINRNMNGNCSHKTVINEADDDVIEDEDEDVVIDEYNDNNNNNSCNSTSNNNNNNNSININNNNNSSRNHSSSEELENTNNEILPRKNGIEENDSVKTNLVKNNMMVGYYAALESKDSFKEDKHDLREESMANDMLIRDRRIKDGKKYWSGPFGHSLIPNGENGNQQMDG
ncbi:inner centromere protein A isoform X2 [Octopus sinensis]|uniref:Inner centromere protein A isoform X2 n=1 Tax=Octopus sinensis TaxID=2607531 RepID=A0A6P7T7G0_9MOLL|nr:inner centromere protein A isoform X2 [Octopus sinensis]XP_036366441.1 inner centromere protein A isoform X2 [Octopus sinensis]